MCQFLGVSIQEPIVDRQVRTRPHQRMNAD